MNEFTGAVLNGQLTKLELICGGLRKNSHYVREGIADLPGLTLRKTPDVDGDLGVGVFLEFPNRELRDRFLRAMRAEGVNASPPGGSAILPISERIENKVTVHPRWPSFQTPEGSAIRYGRECCPRTIDILNRAGGVIMDPKFSEADLQDVVKAIRKVYTALDLA
jgi:dTDP-4-amino-4,6-dideoxygalactose transaminase